MKCKSFDYIFVFLVARRICGSPGRTIRAVSRYTIYRWTISVILVVLIKTFSHSLRVLVYSLSGTVHTRSNSLP